MKYLSLKEITFKVTEILTKIMATVEKQICFSQFPNSVVLNIILESYWQRKNPHKCTLDYLLFFHCPIKLILTLDSIAIL